MAIRFKTDIHSSECFLYERVGIETDQINSSRTDVKVFWCSIYCKKKKVKCSFVNEDAVLHFQFISCQLN